MRSKCIESNMTLFCKVNVQQPGSWLHTHSTDPEQQFQQPGTRLRVTQGEAAAVFDSSFGAVQLQGWARKDEHLKIHHHMVSFSSSAFLCRAATVARSHDSITDEIFFSNAGGKMEKKRNTQYSKQSACGNTGMHINVRTSHPHTLSLPRLLR